MNLGIMIRSNSNNNIRGSTGNLKDIMIMLETMAPAYTAVTFSNKNGGNFSMTSSNSSNKKKNRCISGGNLKHLLYVLEPVVSPLPVIASASVSISVSTNDDWFLGDEEE